MEMARIRTNNLSRSYGDVEALREVSLEVGPGRVLGVLGHNGAGKTTLVDVLSTRIRPTGGSATVCGLDVVADSRRLRRRIGVTGQAVALDELLTGRANLVLLARLLGASRDEAERRADELLTAFGMAEAADRLPRTYSGGMRRRVDLAAGLLGRPEVLFLDEPTAGLDPAGRLEVWAAVGALAADGTTVVLTTQDLEEAENLATDVVVLGQGRVVARGTPDKLKSSIGQRVAKVVTPDAGLLERARKALAEDGLDAVPFPQFSAFTVALPRAEQVASVVRRLDGAGIPIADMSLEQPTLSDVYLTLHRNGWSEL